VGSDSNSWVNELRERESHRERLRDRNLSSEKLAEQLFPKKAKKQEGFELKLKVHTRSDGVEIIKFGNGIELKRSKVEWYLAQFRKIGLVPFAVGFEKESD